MNYVKSFITVLAVLVCSYAHAESIISLTTYYPSPVGVYDQIRLVPRTSPPSNCKEGAIYIPQGTTKPLYCNSTGNWIGLSGIWEENDDDIYISDTDYPNLRVGIGKVSPDALLEISASAGAADLFMISSDDPESGDVFTVLNDGKIGIGNDAPNALLSIDGTSPDINFPVVDIFGNTTNGSLLVIQDQDADITNDDSLVEILDGTGNNIMHVYDHGGIKIGGDPTVDMLTDRLQVTGAVELDTDPGTGQNLLRFKRGSRYYSIGIDTSDNLNINFGNDVGALNHIKMDPSGNVTVGGTLTISTGGEEGDIKVKYDDTGAPGYYATYAP